MGELARNDRAAGIGRLDNRSIHIGLQIEERQIRYASSRQGGRGLIRDADIDGQAGGVISDVRRIVAGTARSANRAGRARCRRTIRQGSRPVQTTDAVDDQALRVEECLATFDRRMRLVAVIEPGIVEIEDNRIESCRSVSPRQPPTRSLPSDVVDAEIELLPRQVGDIPVTPFAVRLTLPGRFSWAVVMLNMKSVIWFDSAVSSASV